MKLITFFMSEKNKLHKNLWIQLKYCINVGLLLYVLYNL